MEYILGTQNSINISCFIFITSINFWTSSFRVYLSHYSRSPSWVWVWLVHPAPSIHTEEMLPKYVMNQWMGESEPHHLFTFSSYLRVTNGDFIVLTFTSSEEIFFFLSTEAVKLNLHLLGSLPRRRHKSTSTNLWRHSKSKVPTGYLRAPGNWSWGGEQPG